MNIQVAIVDGPLPAPKSGPLCENCGADVFFEGRVRPLEEGRLLAALLYETYDPMALMSLRAIAQRLVERYGLLGLVAEHSRGYVAVGECSFRLQVAALHRREAMDAIDAFIDELKQDVPIWKVPVWTQESIVQ